MLTIRTVDWPDEAGRSFTTSLATREAAMTDTNDAEPDGLSPDEAFAVLGDETRLTILQTLGNADTPLAFSELRDRIGYNTTSNFNYHLAKLEGHFVRRTEDGYDLRQAGQRVVEAVLSGAVTDAPTLEATRIAVECPFCSASTAVDYEQERVDMYCTKCSGIFGSVATIPQLSAPGEFGSLGHMSLPPAGLQGRTAADILEAAWAWSYLEFIARGSGICPRCSARIEQSVTICENHDDTDDACDSCSRNYAVHFHTSCTNCINDWSGIVPGLLLGNTEFQAFLTGHGINLTTPEAMDRAMRTFGNYDEEIISTDPFEARFTFTVDEDSLTLTVDDDLTVVDSTSHRATEPV